MVTRNPWTVEDLYAGSTTASTTSAIDTSPGIAISAMSPSLSVKSFTHESWIFWAVALAAITSGLIGFSTAGRAGPVKGSVSVGHA